MADSPLADLRVFSRHYENGRHAVPNVANPMGFFLRNCRL